MLIDLVEIPSIKRIDSPTGRLYETPEGNRYPSVSTILGATADHSSLDEWRAKVGEETAAKISKQATDRGTLIHENIEHFILGRPQTFSIYQQVEREMFNNVKSYLSNISVVRGIETQMWSDKLRVAGTADCICVWNGKLSIVDWKTSNRPKQKEDIPHYFMQCSAYAFMLYERTGLMATDINIVMTTPDDGVWTFNEKIRDWLPKFQEVRKKFDLLQSNYH